jgi:hypothetical protein
VRLTTDLWPNAGNVGGWIATPQRGEKLFSATLQLTHRARLPWYVDAHKESAHARGDQQRTAGKGPGVIARSRAAPRCAIGEECLEPVWSRHVSRVGLAGSVRHAGQYFIDNVDYA